MDSFLIENHDARKNIRETHPEICFWALAGGRTMQFTKKDNNGFEERLTLLKKVFPPTESIVDTAMKKFLRKDVAKDDILDSLAAVIVAGSRSESIISIPKNSEFDELDLPMEMVFTNRNLNFFYGIQ